MPESDLDFSAFIASLEKEALPRVRQAAAQALVDFADHIHSLAAVLVPKQTGTLGRSWTVEPLVLEGWHTVLLVGFNTDYAAAVHERLTNYYSGMPIHHDPPTQWKYLETPLRAEHATLAPLVMKRMQEAL